MFEDLAMPLFDQLYNFAHWLAQDRTEAEDLVQETYVKALKGFSSFQPGTNFRAWMYRILRNTFLTSRTGLKASATIPLDSEDAPELPAGPETPETVLIRVFPEPNPSDRDRILALTLSRGIVAVRSGGNVISRNRGNAVDSDGNRDVTPLACPESAS